MAIHVINPNATPEPAATIHYNAPQFFEYGSAFLDTVSKKAVEMLTKIDLDLAEKTVELQAKADLANKNYLEKVVEVAKESQIQALKFEEAMVKLADVDDGEDISKHPEFIKVIKSLNKKA